MGKHFLLFLVSLSIGFSANAQFWKKPRQERPALLEYPLIKLQLPGNYMVKPVDLKPNVVFARTRYSYDAEEASIMKELYHTLRFRMYPEAIDGMNRLVAIYIEESRYSEAKWYLLQCNYFGHKSNNNNAIVASLVGLGMLKADIGEYDQAKQDLLDAQDICLDQNMANEATEIDKKLKVVEVKRTANVKNDIQYAEAFDTKKG